MFPEKMKKLDVNDVAGSLRTIEEYISYMCERIEHSNSVEKKKNEEEIKRFKQQLDIK